MKKWQGAKYLVGVDEVGRGPVAGPVTVCAFRIDVGDNSSSVLLRGIKDSKKLSQARREKWFDRLSRAREQGMLDFAVSSVGPASIDRDGIVPSVSLATKRALRRLKLDPSKTFVVLDGSISAGPAWPKQKSIVKGDEKVRVISAASVVAKVVRDRKMDRYSKQYPKYRFDKHKGYGTKVHMEEIRKRGMSPIHRQSFLR